MTLEEFINKLNDFKNRSMWEDKKDLVVRVVTADPAVGPSSTTDVAAIGAGFDWDRNSFLIWCEDKVYKNPQTKAIHESP